MGNRFYSLNNYCRETFGEKVYRLSINGGMTCPNRDGSLSYNGCAFCGAGGSGDFATEANPDIAKQLELARARIAAKTNCHSYIAYFQAYTNTYAPVSYLREIFYKAINSPEIVALSIATRSDCLNDDIYELLNELNQIKPVWIELGLQTIHNDTLRDMNTHTCVEDFDYACQRLSALDIKVVTHLILGLPGETREMMLESVKHVAALPVFGIKLQLLHVLRDTALAQQYQQAPFKIFTLEEYCSLIVDCLELLPPEMVIHRMTGDGPRNLLIAPLWSTDKKRVLNTINQMLRSRDTFQGRLFVPNIK